VRVRVRLQTLPVNPWQQFEVSTILIHQELFNKTHSRLLDTTHPN
jgi:hypothetical protein